MPRAFDAPTFGNETRRSHVRSLAAMADDGCSVTLSRDASFISLARQFDSIDNTEIGESARLLGSELATNAVRYGTGDTFEVDVHVDNGILRIEVRDDASVLPTLDEPSAHALGGRGLFIVKWLARRWVLI